MKEIGALDKNRFLAYKKLQKKKKLKWETFKKDNTKN